MEGLSGRRLETPSDVGMEGDPEDFAGVEVNSEEGEGAGLLQSKWRTRQQKRVGGPCQWWEETAAVLEASPAPCAEGQQDANPYVDGLSAFPEVRPVGSVPRTRLTQVTERGAAIERSQRRPTFLP